jgi:chromosome partitioning protein
MEIILFCSHKGGCGKSTSAINLAAYLALSGKKTLLIDLDPQAASTSGLGIDEAGLKKQIYDIMVGDAQISDVVQHTMIEGLDIVPSNIDLIGAELELSNQVAREFVLKNKLSNVTQYDYIILDSPPNLGVLTVNGLVACTKMIIPLQCEFYSLKGMAQLLKMVDMVKTRIGDSPKRRVLLTMYDGRANLSKQVVEQVRDYFKNEVYQTIIPRNVKLAEAPARQKPIAIYDPESTGAEAYRKFADEVLNDVST